MLKKHFKEIFVFTLVLVVSWGFTVMATAYHQALLEGADRVEILTYAVIAADDRTVEVRINVREAEQEAARLQAEIARLKAIKAAAAVLPVSVPAPVTTPTTQPIIVTPVTTVRPERSIVAKPSRSTRAS